MKVTVCELHDEPDRLLQDWDRLVAHVRRERSELVLLPQMPFYPCFTRRRHFDAAVWNSATHAHDAWDARLHELAPACVVGSRPMDFGNERYHAAFMWDDQEGVRTLHGESVVADEHASCWYLAATPDFVPVEVGRVLLAAVFCSEFTLRGELESYAKEGVSLLATPRSVGARSSACGMEAACNAAAATGAYELSSNRVCAGHRIDMGSDAGFSGGGWIIDPQGRVRAQTSAERPFVSLEVAERAGAAA